MVSLMKIAPQVTCDTISLIVEGETYNMDYDFGRRGVRDLGWLLVMMMTMMRIKIIREAIQVKMSQSYGTITMMTMLILLSEVVGNLESTGMVPRLKSNSPRR